VSRPRDNFAGDPTFAPAPVSDPDHYHLRNFPAVVGTNKQDFEYDGLSRLTRATDNNDPADASDDSTVTNACDSLGRVIEETQQSGSLPARAISSAWRAENLRSRLVYPGGSTVFYAYDGLDRVKVISPVDLSRPVPVEQLYAIYNYIGVG